MKTRVIAILILLGSSTLQGQSSDLDPARQLWWVNIGLGPGYAGKDSESGLDAYSLFAGSFTKPLSRSWLLTARATYGEHSSPFFNEYTNYWDGGLIAGLYTKGRVGFASIGAGLGIQGGQGLFGNTQSESFVTVGIPLESQVFLTLPFAGIGIVGFVNLNLKRTSYGMVVALQFGNLR